MSIVLNGTAGTISKGDGSAIGGKAIQIVQTQKLDDFSSTSASYVTLMTAAITPSATSSKILVSCSLPLVNNDDVNHLYCQLYRDSSAIATADTLGNNTPATFVIAQTGVGTQTPQTFQWLDSPSSTSEIDYYVKGKGSNTNGFYMGRSQRNGNTAAYDGSSVSTFTLIEIGA